MPGLWNLYFREQLNTGSSLSAVSRANRDEPQQPVEQDAAMAAADLHEKLQSEKTMSTSAEDVVTCRSSRLPT